jgi:hypothetical protein
MVSNRGPRVDDPPGARHGPEVGTYADPVHSVLVEYGVAVASGLTLALMAALAAGLRHWSSSVAAKVDDLGATLHRSIDRVHDRIDEVDDRARDDHDRIVRVETALLLAPSPARGSEQALQALTDRSTPKRGSDG